MQSFKDDVGFLEDATVKQKLASAKTLKEVSAADYDAIFYIGGHGPVLELASDPVNGKLVSDVRLVSSLLENLYAPLRSLFPLPTRLTRMSWLRPAGRNSNIAAR